MHTNPYKTWSGIEFWILGEMKKASLGSVFSAVLFTFVIKGGEGSDWVGKQCIFVLLYYYIWDSHIIEAGLSFFQYIWSWWLKRWSFLLLSVDKVWDWDVFWLGKQCFRTLLGCFIWTMESTHPFLLNQDGVLPRNCEIQRLSRVVGNFLINFHWYWADFTVESN